MSDLVVPWQDNWPLDVQLWQGDPAPGAEIDLSDPSGRQLAVRWRDIDANTVVMTRSEPHPNFQVLAPATRGVVRIVLQGKDDWIPFRWDRQYRLEVLAYGELAASVPFVIRLPDPGNTLINGVQTYASPRQVLEILGRIPGAAVETFVDLSGSWQRDPRGYWVRDLADGQSIHGLWIEDVAASPVPYERLALTTRGYTQVGNRIYYNGPENLVVAHVQTAHNRYVLRCLEQATADIERRTGRWFNQRLIYRECHRGLYRQPQLMVRHPPVRLDCFFRLDAFTRNRAVWRRYTEAELAPDTPYSYSSSLHLNPQTGQITVAQNFWDWADWRGGDLAVRGIDTLAFLPKGENNLEVTYTGGYERPPTDISEATANLAAMRQAIFWQQQITQGLSGISIGCVSMNFSQLFGQWFPLWQGNAERIIEAYQRIDVEAL